MVGECMNCDNLFTAKEISGLVKARYCKLPTTLLYSVGSCNRAPECIDSFGDVAIGVVTGLAPIILVLSRRSKMYHLWQR